MSDLKLCTPLEKKQQRSTDLILFAVNLLVIYSVYSVMAIEHFSTDGYGHVEGYFFLYPALTHGRAAWVALQYILSLFKINIFAWQEVSIILFIIVLAWTSLRAVQQISTQYTLKEGLLFSVPVLLSVVNVHMQEWFFYSECTFFYAAGMLAAIEAAVSFRKRRYILSMIWVSISVLFYQILLSVFVIYALFFLFLHPKENTLKDYIKLIITGLLGGAVVVVAQKICLSISVYQSPRTLALTPENILGKLEKMTLKFGQTLWNAQDILPPFILPATLLLALVLTICGIAAIHKGNRKAFWYHMMLLLVVIIVSLGVIIGPLLVVSSPVWLAPRVLVGLFTLLSMLSLCAFVMNRGIWRKVMLGMCIILLAVNIYVIQDISIDTFKTNVLDQFISNQVIEYIDQYEDDYDMQVTGIAYYLDSHVEPKFAEIDRCWYDTNTRMQTVDWARTGVIEYYADRNFNDVEADPDVYEMYFADQNWDTFMPDQQLVILDDVLHWCIY